MTPPSWLGIDDRDRAAVIARHVVADADRLQLDLAQLLDVGDHLAQILFEIVAAVGREGRIVDRSAVGNDHQDAALLGAGAQPLMRPHQRAVDVLLQDALARHQPEAAPGPARRRISRLVDDVPQIVEADRARRLADGDPARPRDCPPFHARVVKPRISTLTPRRSNGAGEDIAAHRRDRDRPAAHRAGIVDQRGRHGLAELGLARIDIGR